MTTKTTKTVKATDTNVFCLREALLPDGTIPSRVRSTDAPHLKRCIAAGLVAVVDGTLKITEAGIAAVEEYTKAMGPKTTRNY